MARDRAARLRAACLADANLGLAWEALETARELVGPESSDELYDLFMDVQGLVGGLLCVVDEMAGW